MSTCNQLQFLYSKQISFSPFDGVGILSKSASLGLLLLSPVVKNANSLITNISVIQTKPWFFPLTSFEAMFLGFVILQICVLQLVGILPINLNNLINGSPSGRRRRKREIDIDITKYLNSSHNFEEIGKVIDTLLDTILRADQYGCTGRALCEIEKQRQLGTFIPSVQTQLVLEMVPLFPQRSNMSASSAQKTLFRQNDKFGEHITGIDVYQEAIAIGKMAGVDSNSTICDEKYSLCSSKSDEIIEFINLMRLEEMF